MILARIPIVVRTRPPKAQAVIRARRQSFLRRYRDLHAGSADHGWEAAANAISAIQIATDDRLTDGRTDGRDLTIRSVRPRDLISR